jgi:serine/threonine protein kinase
MMKPSIECLHDEEVGRLLAGEIDAARTSELEQHLANCIDCRQRLEHQVGDDGWWNETESSLRSQHVATSLRDTEDGPAFAASIGETHLRESVLDLLGPTDDPNMLGRIGSYEIVGLLGQGGMGAVFKGFDRSLNRFVAIKLLLPHLAASGAARKRFAREGQAVAAVVDDHVMAIHCVDQWQGVPYLVMTYSRGVSLQKRLSDNGPLEVREILRIGMQAAKGLAAAHAQGIVHRDIKPANIFLDQNVERVQLMDFGLARAVDDASLTRTGVLAGTPQYMSPEQARAEAVDHRSDLFSLGSVMHAMCTGHAPFRAESSYSVLRLITDKEPRPIREINPEVPEWLCMIIAKLMAKQTCDRFASAQEVAVLLESGLAHVQQPSTNPLPAGISKLAVVDEVASPDLAPRSATRRFVHYRNLIAAAFAFVLFFAGVVIVLEMSKGTLTIESEADDVPIRILQGDEIVKSLVVDREGAKTRLHAGQYTLEVDSQNAQYDVTNNQVVVSRGAENLVRITYRATNQTSATPLGPQQGLLVATVEFNNLHPSDAKGKPRPPLGTTEVLALLKYKLGNDELSDEMVKAVKPIVYTREHLLPSGWRFFGGQVDEVCQHGIVHSWQIKLETNGLSKPIVIRKSAMALSTDQKSLATQEAPESMVSVQSLVDQFNATHLEIERRAKLPHDVSPLTPDEVLAALAWSDTENTSSSSSGAITKWLPQILATHHLPKGTKMELIPSIDNAIGQRFTMERIQLLLPVEDNTAKVDATDTLDNNSIVIRNEFVDQALDPDATHWSKPGENGLQVGMRVLPAANSYQLGQVMDIEFLYRSTTSRKIPVTLPATFQFKKVEGIRLERIRFVEPKWPDGTTHTLIGNNPLAVRGHRMQICFNTDDELKPGVNLRAITRPEAHHYVRFSIQNPSDDSQGEILESVERLDFSILPLTPPKVLPLYASHYYQHWGRWTVPGHRLPEQSTPDPAYTDPFQLGVSLAPAEKSQVPAYYASGFRVDKVAPHSPAANVGIEVGDILLSWEGNQFYGDDPNKPFASYKSPNNQLREFLEKYAKGRGWGSFNMDFDLLDHRSGEVIGISPWFGDTASGGPNKTEILKRMAERKLLRQRSE